MSVDEGLASYLEYPCMEVGSAAQIGGYCSSALQMHVAMRGAGLVSSVPLHGGVWLYHKLAALKGG